VRRSTSIADSPVSGSARIRSKPFSTSTRVFCTVGSWPKKFDVEIECIAVV
jgi:hypothetical protein